MPDSGFDPPWMLDKWGKPTPVPKDFGERDQAKLEERQTIAQLGELTPAAAGIECPYNRNDQGPAGMPIRCMVWNDWDDFNDWSTVRGGAQSFCKKVCHYGKSSQEELSKARNTVEHNRARAEQRIDWQKRHGEMRNKGLGILVQPAPTTKVAPFDPGKMGAL